MKKVYSRDGTPIAFDRWGEGAPIILVDGALCHRSFGPMPKLVPLLAKDFTVIHYDRRGRGDSGDTKPYAVEREVEDIEALVQEAGGSASIFGISSGAALALEAANRDLGIRKLALYEAPFIIDNDRPPLADDYVPRLTDAIATDRRGDALKMFMTLVGMPSFMIALMRLMPSWSKLKAVAPTLLYDTAIMEQNQRGRPLPTNRWTRVTAPTLVMFGGKSPAWIKHGMESLARLLPTARLSTLAGQTHMVQAKVLAPPLAEFFRN